MKKLTPHDSPLCVMDPAKLTEWGSIVRSKLIEPNSDLCVVGDTETTGKYELGNKADFGRKDRLLEIGFLFYTESTDGTLIPLLDDSGEQIYFHEYINPFLESDQVLERYNSIRTIPEEVIKHVHGIDLKFLQGEQGLVTKFGGRDTNLLKKPAAPFYRIKPWLELLLDTDGNTDHQSKIKFMAHTLFDTKFLAAEWIMTESLIEQASTPVSFEGLIHSVDTLQLAQMLYSKAALEKMVKGRTIKGRVGYNLDFLQEMFEIDIKRDMHGALLDARILAAVYNEMLKSSAYLDSEKLSRDRDATNKPISSSGVSIKRVGPHMPYAPIEQNT